jgi:biopolymer transport protein ExbB
MTTRISLHARMRRTSTVWLVCLIAAGWAAVAVAQPPEPPPAEPVAEASRPAGAASDTGLPTNLVEIAKALDYWIIPFALATLIALWFSTERLVVLRKGRVIPKPFVDRFLKHLEDGTMSRAEALEVCEENGSPVAMVFAHGVRKWGKPSVEVEQAIIDGGERQVAQLRTHLRVINGVATVTPLLGLLGTVWGMLEAFNDIAVAGSMGNTTMLASGIALALLTTAAGLVIAIPSLIIYMYLSGRVDSLVMDMDDLSQNIVHSISAEALGERGPRSAPRKKAAS